MNRPDLTTLTDEQLVQASNRGLVNRSRRELDEGKLEASVTEKEDGVQLAWSDGVVCTFPPGSSLRGGSCTCAALGVCRHLVRSCLYMRGHLDAATRTSPLEPTRDACAMDLVTMEESALAARLGKGPLERARRRLAEEFIERNVNRERREVLFTKQNARVHFPPSGNESSVSCTCRESPPCSHVLPALLLLRGESPIAAAKALNPEILEARRHAETRLHRLLRELFKVGLDGLSFGWTESARSVAIELEKAGLTKPAYLLSALAREIAADAAHSGRADPARRRWLIAALWLRIAAAPRRKSELPAAERVDDDLVGGTRARYWAEGRRVFLALGCTGWWTEDLVGMTVHLLDEETHEIVTMGTARPSDSGREVASLAASVPLLGEYSARELLSRRVECSSVARADGGKVRLAPGARCVLFPDLVDWRMLADDIGLTQFADVAGHFDQHFPTVRTLHRPDVFLFVPVSFGKGEFLTDRQCFHWEMTDAGGFTAPLVLRYRKENIQAIRSLERLAKQVTPRFVVGQAVLAGGALSIRPMTLVWHAEEEVFTHHVDLDRFASDKPRPVKRRSRNVP